jgi:hypothetical protein
VFAATASAAADRLANTLEMLGDPRRAQHVSPRARRQAPPDAGELKNEQTRVHGCMSTVHLFGRPAVTTSASTSSPIPTPTLSAA